MLATALPSAVSRAAAQMHRSSCGDDGLLGVVSEWRPQQMSRGAVAHDFSSA